MKQFNEAVKRSLIECERIASGYCRIGGNQRSADEKMQIAAYFVCDGWKRDPQHKL